MANLLFKDLDVYKIAHQIGSDVWDVVHGWDYFNKDTLGKQLIRSADSISLNLCEGYGRFYYKEKKFFTIMPGVHCMKRLKDLKKPQKEI